MWNPFAKSKETPPARRGYTPKRGRISRRNAYSAAGGGRLLADWTTGLSSPTADARADLHRLRARARDLCRNNEYASRFVGMVKDNVVGADGVKLQVRAKDTNGTFDKFANDTIEAAWKKWAKKGVCTRDGRLSLTEVERLIVETVARDGEVLVRKLRGRKAGNVFNLSLQVLEVDYLADNYRVSNRNIDLGIERDDFGKPIAYWLYSKNPSNDYDSGGRFVTRVPADEILHLFITERPEQSRGVPWLSSAMFRLKMLDGYEEAEVVAARVAATKMGFFITETGEDYTGDDEDSDGAIIMESEAGTFEQLPPGVTDFKMFDPAHPTAQYSDFVKGVLRGVASGMGVSYVSLANDLEGVNYSSIRQGALEDRDHWRGLQTWLVESFCGPIYESFLLAYLSSTLTTLPPRRFDKFNAPKWAPRGWAWVDPLKEVTANTAAVAQGFKSKSDVLAETGRDFEETLDARKLERELETEAGFTLDPAPGQATKP